MIKNDIITLLLLFEIKHGGRNGVRVTSPQLRPLDMSLRQKTQSFSASENASLGKSFTWSMVHVSLGHTHSFGIIQNEKNLKIDSENLNFSSLLIFDIFS